VGLPDATLPGGVVGEQSGERPLDQTGTVEALPIIDVSPVGVRGFPPEVEAAERQVAEAIDRACRDVGFFVVVGHGVDLELLTDLERSARSFFARPDAEKAEIAMSRGGRAWRGWFPEGGELTAGRADRKEGLYFGTELGPEDPRVRSGLALHGPNLFPTEPPTLRPAVLAWIGAMTTLGHRLVRALGIGLGLAPDWFDAHLTADPTVLFRIFRYPPQQESDGWGVGEHTDYGLLTILATDGRPGLEVHAPSGWLEVPAVPGGFVVNLGDMLEAMTGGAYRSTPHRVRHRGPSDAGDRLSFPCFFDPGWSAHIRPVDGVAGLGARAPHRERWDGTAVDGWSGTYGDYLTAKVAQVFPQLATHLD
jgi:isopenicillin N synthase-like dioxygenase